MTNQKRFFLWLIQNDLAESATLTITSGSECPCMVSWDSNTSMYSEQWHRDNTSASDCNGTGIIHATDTDTAIRGVFAPPGLVGQSIPSGKEFLESIGEVQKDDLILWGVCNTSAVEVSLVDRTEYTAKITKATVNYTIKDVSVFASLIGQVARLVRRT